MPPGTQPPSPLERSRAILEATSRAAEKKDWAQMQRVCAEGVRLFPRNPLLLYNLACATARLGRAEEALEHLARSVELGFRDAEHISLDPDLESLRTAERFGPTFREIVEKARTLGVPGWERTDATPAAVEGGVALVRPENSAWDPRTGTFRTLFSLDALPPREAPVIRNEGEAGAMILSWYAEGTAAGSHGDFYDNRDGDHSNMSCGDFPQLTRIEYSKDAIDRQLHWGLSLFLFNGVVLGNASIAATQGPAWRSMPRTIYVSPRHLAVALLQYANNHLYVYPEHRDHDPADGEPEATGLGDLFPANTPYLITSQGSSGSDVVFLNALASTLAAFRPEVKRFLADSRAIAPTLQLILRSCLSTTGTPTAGTPTAGAPTVGAPAPGTPTDSTTPPGGPMTGAPAAGTPTPGTPTPFRPEAYLTGRAHPSVFSGRSLDPRRMAQMAHDMRKEAVPPLVDLAVLEEDGATLGVDYFDPAPAHGVRLFDSTCAVARVMRSVKHTYRIVVSASKSRDLNGARLTWHWTVLRGDERRIGIRRLSDDGSTVELTVGYHERRPVHPGGRLESSRVDVGAFVHNGTYYSAPAFVTFYFLSDERREYGEGERILSVDYTRRGPYEDPLLSVPRGWKDEYAYDEGGRLLGWTRRRGSSEESFTAEGALVTKRDELGRPAEARTVVYSVRDAGRPGQEVGYASGDEVLTYGYASDKDRKGEVVSRTPAER